jgi:hypothetical protein
MRKMYPRLKPIKVKWMGKRIVGCQSANHAVCKGELWECERCHKIICWEEGSTDLPEICDDCWVGVRELGHEYSIGIESTWRLNYETT